MQDAGSRSRGAGVVVVGLGIALALLDFVVLRGEVVARDPVRLSEGPPARLELGRIGEEHTFQIRTTRRSRGETRGRAIAWRLVAPDGRVVEEGSELRSRKRRFFDHTPDTAGTYELHVEDGGVISGLGSGSASVEVLVGDRRIASRLFVFF